MVKLTNSETKAGIFINMDHIATLEADKKQSKILLANGHVVTVSENIDAVTLALGLRQPVPILRPVRLPASAPNPPEPEIA